MSLIEILLVAILSLSLFREIVYIASLPLGGPGWAFGEALVGLYLFITALTTNQKC